MSKVGPNIKDNEDIAKEVAQEMNISEEMVKYHIDFLIHWIKCLTKKVTVNNIYIPHLGFLYMKWGAFKKERIGYAKVTEKVGSQIENDKLDTEREKIIEAYREKDKREFSRHMRRSKFRNYYFNKGKTIQELEEWQNQDL